MDVYWRIGILILSFFVLLYLLKGLFEKRRLQKIEGNQSKRPKQEDLPNDLLIIYVIAKEGSHFSSYDLLQAITASGMQYGEMNIFHYYDEDHHSKKKILFSLASSTEPGEFDLNYIGNLSCVGLTLFMNIRKVPDPLDAFVIMLDTAKQLANDLDGELRATPSLPWTDETQQRYQKKILTSQHAL